MARLAAAPLGLAGRVLYFQVRWHELRARAAVALARADDDGRALRVAEREVRALEALALPWPAAHAALLRGGIASVAGDRAAARRYLAEGRGRVEALGMRLWAEAARLREAELGGEEAEEAEAWMRGEGVVAPGKIGRQLVPL
jgi:hypothetical protein